MIQQCRIDRKRGGVGLGKVLEPVFEVGTPVTQQHYMLTRLPTRLSVQTDMLDFKYTFKIEGFLYIYIYG